MRMIAVQDTVSGRLGDGGRLTTRRLWRSRGGGGGGGGSRQVVGVQVDPAGEHHLVSGHHHQRLGLLGERDPHQT